MQYVVNIKRSQMLKLSAGETKAEFFQPLGSTKDWWVEFDSALIPDASDMEILATYGARTSRLVRKLWK